MSSVWGALTVGAVYDLPLGDVAQLWIDPETGQPGVSEHHRIYPRLLQCKSGSFRLGAYRTLGVVLGVLARLKSSINGLPTPFLWHPLAPARGAI